MAILHKSILISLNLNCRVVCIRNDFGCIQRYTLWHISLLGSTSPHNHCFQCLILLWHIVLPFYNVYYLYYFQMKLRVQKYYLMLTFLNYNYIRSLYGDSNSSGYCAGSFDYVHLAFLHLLLRFKFALVDRVSILAFIAN